MVPVFLFSLCEVAVQPQAVVSSSSSSSSINSSHTPVGKPTVVWLGYTVLIVTKFIVAKERGRNRRSEGGVHIHTHTNKQTNKRTDVRALLSSSCLCFFYPPLRAHFRSNVPTTTTSSLHSPSPFSPRLCIPQSDGECSCLPACRFFFKKKNRNPPPPTMHT